jgi:hypothetical protein
MKVAFTSFKSVQLSKRSRLAGEDVKEAVLEVLRAVERVYRQWAYVAKLPTGEQALHTARLILPRETKGAVILDATAKANVLYKLFGDRVEIRESAPARNYSNVRFHVSRGHKTGKGYIVEEAEKAAAEIIPNLERHLSAARKVLIVTHKGAEPAFKQFETAFTSFTAHWGAIDGSNEWRDCDAICLVSLLHRGDPWATSSYFAITGDVQDEFLGDEGDQMRQEIHVGQLVSDMAQAIGRTRCRRVVDEEGNCDPVDVFLLIPDSPLGTAVVRGLLNHFHGAKQYEFHYSGTVTKAKPKASKIEDAFLLCLRGLPSGMWTAKELREQFFKGCSPASWKRLMAAMRDTASELHRQMVDLGIRFTPGKWRGAPAVFHKA